MIPLASPPKIVSSNEHNAVFEIEGLYPGYGITLGNSLRRVLLSSLEGSAATQVKIKGAAHEFATLDGVKEDVVVILMNLKKLRFKLHTDEPQTVTLKAKGEKKVTGRDFKLPAQVELANPETQIAELTTKSTEFELELQVGKGVGYEAIEIRKKTKESILGFTNSRRYLLITIEAVSKNAESTAYKYPLFILTPKIYIE